MIDEEGFRLNVGIIVHNDAGRLLWCRRLGKPHAWQFPQGGIQEAESPQEAMYRELLEEVGLTAADVMPVAESRQWLSYLLPLGLRRQHSKPLCVGQKQKWYLLRLINDDEAIRLDATLPQEFDQWRWVEYWRPVSEVVSFKKSVYQQILTEFSFYLDQKISE